MWLVCAWTTRLATYAHARAQHESICRSPVLEPVGLVNMWVITWIQTGLGTGSLGPQMITYRLPVCICTCPNLHDSPMLLPGSDTSTSSTIPEVALSDGVTMGSGGMGMIQGCMDAVLASMWRQPVKLDGSTSLLGWGSGSDALWPRKPEEIINNPLAQ